MGLDKDKMPVDYALRMAKQYYPEDKYVHAIRVMQYIADNEMIQSEYKDDCLSLAIMHDLWEDTKYPRGCGLGECFTKALTLLTKPKDKDYIEYIKEIRDTEYTSNWHMCAWWVKLADMKDHLAQTETLTDKLKEKYIRALPYLL